MSKEDVRSLLGTPSYQYALLGRETWVYEESSYLADQAKETALNMVPVIGPGASFFMDLNPTIESAKAAVRFDSKGNVASFTQADASTTQTKDRHQPTSSIGSVEDRATKPEKSKPRRLGRNLKRLPD